MTKKAGFLLSDWAALGFALGFEVVIHVFHLFPLSIHLGQGTVPWLMARHGVLYQTILEHRPPLTAWVVYLVQPLFRGDTLLTVMVLHIVCMVVTTVLLFWAARRLDIPYAASLTVLYFALLEPIFCPIAFYFEVVQGLLYAGVFLLLMQSINTRQTLLGTGVLLGLAFFAKQQAIFVIGWVLLWVWWKNRKWQEVMICAVGVALPSIVIWGSYIAAGKWDDYYYWNFTFNARYGQTSFVAPTGDFLRRMILTQGWLFPLALMALRKGKEYWLLVGMGLAAQATHYPRSSEMHAGAALPMISLAFGAVAASLLPRTSKWREWSLETLLTSGLLLVVLAAILSNAVTRFVPSSAGFQAVLGKSEFDDITAWMETHAEPGDSLYVLPASDSTAQLHPLTGLEPPGTWAIGNVYVHAPHFVTDRLLAEWDSTPPTWLIWFPEMTEELSSVYFQPLIDFMFTDYDEVARFDDLPFYGEAVIWQKKSSF